jgi:hypothetical protein
MFNPCNRELIGRIVYMRANNLIFRGFEVFMPASFVLGNCVVVN